MDMLKIPSFQETHINLSRFLPFLSQTTVIFYRFSLTKVEEETKVLNGKFRADVGHDIIHPGH
jgi:hypothetical protein